MPDTKHDVRIEATAPEQRADALRHLHLSPTQVSQLLKNHRDGLLNMDGLFHAIRSGSLVGAVWGQILPGRMGYSWPARVLANEAAETANQLQRRAEQFLDASQVALCQSVVEDRDGPLARQLSRVGYRHLTDLDFLVAAPNRTPSQLNTYQPNTAELDYEIVTRTTRSRLKQIIQQTYRQTLDCPELDQLRDIDDVLEGYQRTGTHRPDWWLIATCGGEDLGCLLMADHPNVDQCELVYMGLVPEKRGHGWGLQIARKAQQLAAEAGRPRLTLAVDQTNWPALALYEAAGFEKWTARSILIRKGAA
jgi:mycothiol synthase